MLSLALLSKLHSFSCYAMLGVIWIIQLVHYPSFLWVDKKKMREFSRFHADSITPVVLPLMVTELGSACGLLYFGGAISTAGLLNVASIAIIWLWTFLVSVPCHERLSAEGWDVGTVRWLIRSNWLRTVVWSSRSAVLLFLPGFAGGEGRSVC